MPVGRQFAGRLNKLVTIQARADTTDSSGASTSSWTDFATVWAGFETNPGGREFFSVQQLSAEITTRITIRYRDGVIPSMRVIYGSRNWDILSVVNPDEGRHELHLYAREVL